MVQSYKQNQISTGIEISDDWMKRIEMKMNRRGRLEILQVVKEDLPHGIIVGGKIEQMDQAIHALKKMLKLHGNRHTVENVHIAIPSQFVTVRFLTLPDLPLRHLKKMIDFEVRHQLYLPFGDPYYDFVKLDKETGATSKSSSKKKESSSKKKESDPTCSVMVVAAPMSVVEQYGDMFKAAGVRLRSIEIKAFSLQRLVTSLGLATDYDAYMVADLSDVISDVSIFNQGQLKITRSVPVHFTSRADDVDREEKGRGGALEQMLMEVAAAKSDPAEVNVFDAACSVVGHEIERLMKFYRYSLNHRTQEFKGLILSGDLPRLPDVANYLQERLGVNVLPLEIPTAYLARHDEDLDVASFATVMGTGLRGMIK